MLVFLFLVDFLEAQELVDEEVLCFNFLSLTTFEEGSLDLFLIGD